MKRFFIILLAICLNGFIASAQMTDDALIQYVTEGVAEGKTQNQMASELASKGVSVAQMRRVMSNYKNLGDLRASVGENQKAEKIDETRNERPATQVEDKKTVKEEETDKKKDDVAKKIKDAHITGKETKSLELEKKIYGHDIFTNKSLTFEPNSNAATPDSYVLGPGDEVIIDVWGENEATLRQTITPEGLIMVSQVGPIQLAGLTIDAARARIRKSIAKKYAALNWSASQVSVTLGRARTIMVNVMGEVNVPGTYRLSSFATVFNALYNAGGITDIGSVRSVKVSRGNRIIANVDIYQYLFNGYASTDIPLKDGDIIIVPASGLVVDITGEVKRPMFYELAEGETLAKALEYAGGFSSNAYRGNISVVRQTGAEQMVYNISENEYSSFTLADGDSFVVMPALERYKNSLKISGAVKYPGIYQFGDDVKTVSQLIARCGGLREDAFAGRALLVREQEDLTHKVIALPVKGIINGTEPDFVLEGNDVIFIPSINDVERKGGITINGYVRNPGIYPYADNVTVEDVIVVAGGLLDGASTANVEVSRRYVDPLSTTSTEQIAEVFSFQIKDGLVADGKPGFILMPNDVVSVRRSPVYSEQKTVNLIGEFVFPGQYTLKSSGERISDLIERAGGVTKTANLRGVMLKRQITDDEREIRKTIAEVYKNSAKEESDTTVTNLVEDIYNVGVKFDKAINHPGSEYDLVLRDGDELIIPEMNSTVSIQGEVLYPNTVPYIEGRSVQFYINQAGGCAEHSRKSRTYVVYSNGSVSSGLLAKVEPGCAIVVPKKAERQRISASEAISMGSSSASLAAVVLSIVNMLK